MCTETLRCYEAAEMDKIKHFYNYNLDRGEICRNNYNIEDTKYPKKGTENNSSTIQKVRDNFLILENRMRKIL